VWGKTLESFDTINDRPIRYMNEIHADATESQILSSGMSDAVLK